MPELSNIEIVANLPGEPRAVSAAGVTRTEQRLLTLENASPFDSTNAHRRLSSSPTTRARRAQRSPRFAGSKPLLLEASAIAGPSVPCC